MKRSFRPDLPFVRKGPDGALICDRVAIVTDVGAVTHGVPTDRSVLAAGRDPDLAPVLAADRVPDSGFEPGERVALGLVHQVQSGRPGGLVEGADLHPVHITEPVLPTTLNAKGLGCMVGCGLSGEGPTQGGRTVSEISRRTVLGAAGTTAAAAFLTTAGAGQAVATAGDKSEDTRQAANQETDIPMAVTTEEQKYEAYVANDEGEWLTHAIFDAHSDTGDMWAFVDAALVRLRQKYPNWTFTGYVRRYDQVITDIAHP
jgi:hypothetical protein